jgi:C2 domain
MTNMTRRLAPAALAAALLFAAGCGDEGMPTCGPSTCSGCCTLGGLCIGSAISVHTVGSCGLSGVGCSICQATERCTNGACSEECGPSTCPTGCCDGSRCVTSPTNQSCGRGGGVCMICGATEECFLGQCKKAPCGPSTCPNGCCFNDACLPGKNPGVCGKGGAACDVCKNGEKCENQACKTVACGPGSCNGCCDPNGNCAPGNSESNCGGAGNVCIACKDKEICTGGICKPTTTTCNASTCASGCCDATGQCQPGNTPGACGTGGAACSACSSTQGCVSGKCTCTTTSCSGCCQGDKCMPGHLDATCGLKGAPCQQCTGATSCNGGICKAGCSFSNCSQGCCEGTVCKNGLDKTACGAVGYLCVACGPWETCTNGVCNDSFLCSPSSCNNGCCKGSACQSGTQDAACGKTGGVCTLCPPSSACNAQGACVLKPTAKWKVSVQLVKVDNQKKYDPWPANPAPDIFVELKVGGITKKTQTIDNNYDPVFNEYVFSATVNELLGAIQISIWDFDPYDPNDPIASCSNTFFASEIKAGKATIYYCGSSSDLKQITFTFVPE